MKDKRKNEKPHKLRKNNNGGKQLRKREGQREKERNAFRRHEQREAHAVEMQTKNRGVRDEGSDFREKGEKKGHVVAFTITLYCVM